MFRGSGTGDLPCRCGSVLIQGYLPANFLAIRLQCFHCGAVTITPGLPDGEILPRSAVSVAPLHTPVVTTSNINRGAVLACQNAIARGYALTQPRGWPTEPPLLSHAMLDAAAADYDRLTGGRLAEHGAASPPALGAEHGPYPFAWALQRLREQIDKPNWAWMQFDDDAMATMYVTALHHLMHCWGQHPLLARLAAPLAHADRFIRTVTGFATAKLLFDAGNRVGFSPSANDVDLHFTTPADEPLSLELLAPESLQWGQKERRSPDVCRATVANALISVQARVNRLHPGMVVLAASILHPEFDQMIIDAIHAAFQSVGRRHRGVAAVAVVIPKVMPAGPPDRIGFAYAFYPILNPRFAGENPIRLRLE